MHRISRQKNMKYYFLISSIYIFVFQNWLQNYIKFFQYFDEIFSMLFFPIFIIYALNGKKFKINRTYLSIIALLAMIIFIGLYSNIVHEYQIMNQVLSDILINSKVYLSLIGMGILFQDFDLDMYGKKIQKHITMISHMLFCLLLLNYIFRLFPNADIRYGLPSQKLFYYHPTHFAAIIVFILGFICLLKKYEKHHKWLIIECLLMLTSTLRSKAVAMAIVFLILYWIILHKKKKITVNKWIIMGSILVLIGWQQIEYYFITLGEGSARAALLLKSIEIAKDYFPIGTGFATYASYSSSVEYSPIYFMYGLNHVWGLSENSSFFVSDSFWPMILGQFGIIGLILYCIMLYKIFNYIQSKYLISIEEYSASMVIFVYLLISSTSESAFVNPIAVPLMLILVLSYKGQIGNKYKNKIYEENI